MSPVVQVELISVSAIGLGTGAYLVQRGVWYQGKQKGFKTRAGSIVLGLLLFFGGIVLISFGLFIA